MWQLTVIRDGLPWTVQQFNPGSLPSIEGPEGVQAAMSADGEEIIFAGLGNDPWVTAISTTTGEESWSHQVYSTDPEMRSGILIGSPKAGIYLWRDRDWSAHNMGVAWNPGTGQFDDFPIPLDTYPYPEASWWYRAIWTEGGSPYYLDYWFLNNVTITTNWDGNHTTSQEYNGNLAYNANWVYGTYPRQWSGYVNGYVALPPQTGNTASYTVHGDYPTRWVTSSAGLEVNWPALGTADSSVIELRGSAGEILDTVIDPDGATLKDWVAIQPGVNGYAWSQDLGAGHNIYYRALLTSDVDTLAWASVEQEIVTGLYGGYSPYISAWDGMIGITLVPSGKGPG